MSPKYLKYLISIKEVERARTDVFLFLLFNKHKNHSSLKRSPCYANLLYKVQEIKKQGQDQEH